jgi:hypothetical protein
MLSERTQVITFYYSNEIFLQSIFVAACCCCHTLHTSANLIQVLQRKLNSRTGQDHTERISGYTRLVLCRDIGFMIKKNRIVVMVRGKIMKKTSV